MLRNLETLGEAAKKLNSRTRALSAGTPWREIAGFRDVIAHDYLEVDLDLVWNVIESELPGLRETVIDLLGRVDT